MNGMNMGPALAAHPALPMSVPVMAAMMLPSAVPAIARRAREPDGVLAAPLFTGSYLGTWALAALAMCLLYRPGGRVGFVPAGALMVGAGVYELTPLKRACRRRCRERVRSGLRFGVYCFGSSIGLMLVLVGVDVMSVPMMVAIAVVVLAQKLLPPHPVVDVPLALAIVALGVATAAT
jgi:predicted metal-binding membrane protein